MEVKIKPIVLKNVEEILDEVVKGYTTYTAIPMERKYAGKRVKIIILGEKDDKRRARKNK